MLACVVVGKVFSFVLYHFGYVTAFVQLIKRYFNTHRIAVITLAFVSVAPCDKSGGSFFDGRPHAIKGNGKAIGADHIIIINRGWLNPFIEDEVCFLPRALAIYELLQLRDFVVCNFFPCSVFGIEDNRLTVFIVAAGDSTLT